MYVQFLKAESLYSSPNIVKVGGTCGTHGRGVYRVLVGRPEGKRPLEKPSHTWEDNIKLDLWQIGIDEANWIQLAQDSVQWLAFVNTNMNLRVT
jgi:hypothetical protein